MTQKVGLDMLEGDAQGISFVNAAPYPTRKGFYSDVGGANIQRFRDRTFFGDATKHTGNRFAPLGGTWLTERGANWFEKNSLVHILTPVEDGKFGLLCANYVNPTGPQDGGAGIMAISVNDRDNSFSSRAGYFECFLNSNGGGTAGIEIQVGNYGTTDPNPTPYGTGPGASGITIGVEAGFNYVRGDADIPVPTPTMPAGAAAIIGGGSGGQSFRRWKKGMIFRDDALYRGVTGTSGNGTAISMAQNHQIEWMASGATLGAIIRSDVTAVASQDVGILFKNNLVQITQTGEITMAQFSRDTVGTPVNFLDFKNARTNVGPTISATGTDANVIMMIQSKGQGVIRFLTGAGANEQVRITPPANAVNYLTLSGSGTANPVTIGVSGTDANTDIMISPVGTGRFRFGYNSTAATTPANFSAARYIPIRDLSGTLYYLPLALAPW